MNQVGSFTWLIVVVFELSLIGSFLTINVPAVFSDYST